MASSSSGPPGGQATNFYEGRPTEATAPLWADPSNGNLQILLLRATGDKVLPTNPFTVSKTINAVAKDFNSAKPQRDEKKKLQYILTTRDEDVVANGCDIVGATANDLVLHLRIPSIYMTRRRLSDGCEEIYVNLQLGTNRCCT
ncbi:uncharacterized protein LOC129777862 isoform X2 [Toxorhynchites rutilus septentrionalis]|uniref:uncharacterized protein LOC129777862 isoform X2 n=1 Tax=Toxorhynchites rutilus septentrionalis TaxID=329112 RepID=UPI002478F079|nr:uncharacterized protein LOC129777862 isoform X2 [Toxorhynchites rutilus septentrionalis]